MQRFRACARRLHCCSPWVWACLPVPALLPERGPKVRLLQPTVSIPRRSRPWTAGCSVWIGPARRISFPTASISPCVMISVARLPCAWRRAGISTRRGCTSPGASGSKCAESGWKCRASPRSWSRRSRRTARSSASGTSADARSGGRAKRLRRVGAARLPPRRRRPALRVDTTQHAPVRATAASERRVSGASRALSLFPGQNRGIWSASSRRLARCVRRRGDPPAGGGPAPRARSRRATNPSNLPGRQRSSGAASARCRLQFEQGKDIPAVPRATAAPRRSRLRPARSRALWFPVPVERLPPGRSHRAEPLRQVGAIRTDHAANDAGHAPGGSIDVLRHGWLFSGPGSDDVSAGSDGHRPGLPRRHRDHRQGGLADHHPERQDRRAGAALGRPRLLGEARRRARLDAEARDQARRRDPLHRRDPSRRGPGREGHPTVVGVQGVARWSLER